MASTCGHNYGQQCKCTCNLRNTVYGLSGNTHLSKRQIDVSTGLCRIPNKSLEKIYRRLFPYLEQEIRFTPFFYMVNNLDPSITFTKEEDNKALPFLDIMVIKNHDNTIATDIFYKPTNSQRYLDFRSCHRHHTKVNVPFNLAQRICKIVSEEQRRDFRLEELKTFLISCYYPQELINQAINTAKDQNNSFTLNLQNPDIIPLVITNNPNHIKNLINNVKCPRLKRAFKNKPLL